MSSAPNKPGEVAGERKKKESILDMSRFRVNNGISRNGKARPNIASASMVNHTPSYSLDMAPWCTYQCSFLKPFWLLITAIQTFYFISQF